MNGQFFPEANQRLNRELHERLLEEAENARLVRKAARGPLLRKEKRISLRLVKAEKKSEEVKVKDETSGPAVPHRRSTLLDPT